MAVLEWGAKTEDRYVSGVSQGVFYDDTGKAYPWDGLISITEKPQTVDPTPVYNSLGLKYDLHGNASEKRHSLICYTYPEIMDEYLGMEYLDEFGCLVDERPPRKFNMVYRSDHDDHYVIHVLLGQIANFGELPHTTDSHTPGISNISMNLEGTQHEVYGTSHLMFDSRNPITASAERILFGTRNEDACFNKFLDAEVVWIPQAINYAPTIEPDYENPVLINSVNYPGIKNSSKWNTTNVVPYWDEVAEQLALHSESTEEWTQSKLSIPLDVSIPIDLKTSADINFGGMVDEVVGENLFLGSHFLDDNSTSDWKNPYGTHSIVDSNYRFEVTSDTNLGAVRLERVVDIADAGIYTYTLFIKSPRKLEFRMLINASIVSVHEDSSPDANGYIRSSMTFECLEPGPTTLRAYLIGAETGDVALVDWVKLERGSVATAWSPAPEEALHRRIIGTREPQVLSEQAPNIIGSQTVTLNSTVSDNPHVDIYHNGPVGSDDVRVNNLIVTLQNYNGEFFDGNTVPKTRGERYRRVESEAGYYTVYEHLRFTTQSEIELRTIGTELYELTAPETQLSIDGDQFTFIGPQATSTGDGTFEIDDTIL